MIFCYFFSKVSDTCSNGLAIDTSGPYLETAFQTIFNPTRIKYEIVPDDMNKIEVITYLLLL